MSTLDRALEIYDEDRDLPDYCTVHPVYPLTKAEWREAVAELAALRARIVELEEAERVIAWYAADDLRMVDNGILSDVNERPAAKWMEQK